MFVGVIASAADLGVFLSADCNVSAIASAVVARDSASPGLDRSDAFRRSSIASLDESGGAPSHSEQFIQRIDEAVHRIDRVISEHVTEHHMELLGQVGSVDGLQGQVSSVQSSVQHLKSAVDALETNVREQHRKLQVTIQKHRNVEQCGEIVRRVLRFHQLSERVLGSPLATAGLLSTSTTGSASRGVGAANHAEMVTLALAIREMETLVEDPSFEELSVVRAKLPAIRKLSAAVKRDVRANLRTGMQNVSQAEVGDALQVLFYLGGLAPTVQGAVNDVIQEVERACGAAIAEEKLYRRNSLSTGTNGTSNNSAGGDSGSSATHAVVQKADIWKAIQDVFEAIRTHAIQVWNLQRVLVKMVDPATNSRYIDLVIGKDEPTLFATFWEVTCAIVRELFASMLNYRSAVKTVLVSEYPRMREQAHRVLNDLYAATNQNAGPEYTTEKSVGAGKNAAKTYSIGIAGSPAERSQLLDSMSPLYGAFTERLYRRLSNPIQLMFPQSSNFHASPPGRSDMQTLARTIFAELDQVGKDPVLLEGSLKQIRKAVTLFCTNVKKIMNTGKTASATTPSFGRTAAQAHNVSLITVLGILDDAIEEVERRVVAEATESAAAANAETTRSMSMVRVSNDGKITEKQAKRVCANELTPCHDIIGDMEYALLGYYLQSLASILEGVFAKMHDESFADRAPSTPGPSGGGGAQQRHNMGDGLSSSSTNGSKYMQEFTSVFAVILDEHLRRLPPSSFVSECVGDFVCRLISVFVRHASLLRPLQENGKLRLANDMAQLELWLEHIMPLKNLGAPYDELRAFRQLIFLKSASLLRDPAVDKIRPSNVWHHLIARAPPELQLPHQMKRWNVSKYIDWLDTEVPVDIRSTFSPPPGPFAWKDLPLGYPCLKDRRLALLTEKSVWKEITKCLDAYAQRVSAASGVDLSPVYELVQESGPILLAGYEVAYPV